jgi:hypothetical protein
MKNVLAQRLDQTARPSSRIRRIKPQSGLSVIPLLNNIIEIQSLCDIDKADLDVANGEVRDL